jgi:polyisoprenoid-binding protein YceI
MARSYKLIPVLMLFILAGFTLAYTQMSSKTWDIDRSHSSVNFEIKHFFTKVPGKFEEFDADITFDPENLEESSISATIQAVSVNTEHERRDGDLRGDSFFDVENYPTITFVSSSIESTGENEFVAHGTLTVKDVSKEFDLPFTLLGVQDHPFREGQQIAGISSEFTIKRNDYNIGTGNWVTDAILSYDVDVAINLELRADK